MCAAVLFLACFPFAGHPRRLQGAQEEENRHSTLEMLARLLLSSNPDAAFSLASLGAYFPRDPIKSTSFAWIRSPVMQAEVADQLEELEVQPRARGRARGQARGRGRARGRGEIKAQQHSDSEASGIQDKRAECPKGIHIGVIGAGPIGMTAAAIAKSRGYCLTVLEKQDGVGGDWRRWGNPWSKLQSHRDAYLIRAPHHVPVDGEDQLALYPSRGQMLEYFQRYAEQTGIYDDIIFNATVTSRDGTQLFYEKDGEKKSIVFSHIFAAPGRVNTRSEMSFDSEDTFRGKVALGTGGDLIGFDWEGKNVVIVGHGSFAIENARHALESGAAQVTLIARTETLVYPRVVGYAIDWGRFDDRRFVIESTRQMYDIAGYPWGWTYEMAQPPFLTMPPTSDIFFLAQAVRKLKVVCGEVAKLQEYSVVTKDGDVFPADVFIKCLGFKRDTKLDAELKKPGSGNIEEEWFMNFVDEEKRVYVGSYSNLETNNYANAIPHDRLPGDFFKHVDGNGSVGGSSRQWQDPLDFFVEVRNEWSNYCRLFGISIPYPYSEEDIKSAFRMDGYS